MRVEIHPADDGGCGRYRISWAADLLAAQGMDVGRGPTFTLVHQAGPHGPSDDDPIIGANPPDADVVVLQRPLKRVLAQAIPFIQAAGIAVVVEVDDDFHSLPVSNPAHEQVDPRRDRNYHREWLMEACRAADVVTCTTEALADRYGHGHAVVIPNYVRARWLDLQPAVADPPVLGWTGVVTTHGGDLEAMGSPMPLPKGWHFRNIGSVRSRTVLGVPSSRFQSRPWLDLNTDAYPLALGEFTIGVVPLAASHFNRAKSWLKGIEYAALGVPFVASRVTAYRDLWRHGIGMLAASPADWRQHIGMLAASAELRAEVGGTGREAMRELTIEANVHRWADAWQLALDRRRARR